MSKKWAYYNDNDKDKCAWLRELIKAGAITDGEVDDRRIEDVEPNDVAGFERVHWCAGIGAWDYALNLAQWGDRPVWTASFPCPSFSAAGKGGGFNDPRHIWPVGFQLIRECRPPVLFMEQVGAAIGYGWLDLVSADLEGEDYAIGASVLGACSVGAPHIRQRLYILAYSSSSGCRSRLCDHRPARERRNVAANSNGNGGMADTDQLSPREGRGDDAEVRGIPQTECGSEHGAALPGRSSQSECMADSDNERQQQKSRIEGPASLQREGTEPAQKRQYPGNYSASPECMADSQCDDRRTDLAQRQAQGRTAHGGNGAAGILAKSNSGDSRKRQRLIGRERFAESDEAGKLGDSESGRLGVRGTAPGQSGRLVLTDEPGIVVNTVEPGLEGLGGNGDNGHRSRWNGEDETRPVAETGEPGGMADTDRERRVVQTTRLHERRDGESSEEPTQETTDGTSWDDDERCDEAGSMADSAGIRLEEQVEQFRHGIVELQTGDLPSDDGAEPCTDDEPAGQLGFFDAPADGTGPVNGFWRDADWLFCRDGRWRPARPGSFPLATGVAARLVRLRGYGDAINSQVAAAFIAAAKEAIDCIAAGYSRDI